MPKVTIEYALPEEKQALEDAIMGADAARALEQLREFMEHERIVAARAERGTPEHDYGRGVDACLDHLDKLLKGEQEPPEPPPTDPDDA